MTRLVELAIPVSSGVMEKLVSGATGMAERWT